MQSSEDIGQVVEAVDRELNGLGQLMITASIAIYRSELEQEQWFTGPDVQARNTNQVPQAVSTAGHVDDGAAPLPALPPLPRQPVPGTTSANLSNYSPMVRQGRESRRWQNPAR